MSRTETVSPAGVEAFAAAVDDFMRATRRARGRLAHEGDISISQYHLLEPLLGTAEPLGVGELAAAAGVSAPTATRMLAALERDGIAERRTSASDRRIVHVTLTADGLERVRAKRGRIEARRAELYESLTPAERDQAARLLERLAAAIEDMR
jgi:MarR family transcriptional regulator, organic hydroperoxide resistance regulator